MLAKPELDDIHGYYFEDLSVGMSASYAKTITETDIVLFAGISGDVNPVHLNQEFASDTMFEGRIAHGMLTASFISTVLGTKLPGPGCIYLRQDLRFRTRPARRHRQYPNHNHRDRYRAKARLCPHRVPRWRRLGCRGRRDPVRPEAG